MRMCDSWRAYRNFGSLRAFPFLPFTPHPFLVTISSLNTELKPQRPEDWEGVAATMSATIEVQNIVKEASSIMLANAAIAAVGFF